VQLNQHRKDTRDPIYRKTLALSANPLGEQYMKPDNTRSNNKQDFLKTTFTEPVLTVEDVASYLRIKEETVRMMARKKKIPAIKVGKAWRFRLSEIKETLNAGRTSQS